MFRNETGLQVIESGDVVKVGTGKVLYSVVNEAAPGTYNIQSHNTGKFKFVELEKLVLVTNVRDTDDWKEAHAEPEEGPVEETSAYAKAVLFALNKFQKHVYAGTVSDKTKGKRRALGRRQKASRKANR